jgi:RHS repeat-associated protein
VNNESLGSYGYDGNGKRVKKSESGTTTWYVISSVLGSAMEVTSSGVQRAYVMSGNAVVAQLNPNGQFYWLHLDHLGSGRKMTDSSGNMVYRAEFDPYGKLLYEWSSPTNLNTKKFTGYERDAATNLDYAQARMYASEWGRFLSPDPIGLKSANRSIPQSLNRYSYVWNNPVNGVDPSGLLTLLVYGTGNDPNEHEWAREGSDFWNAVYDTFKDVNQYAFDWREYSGALQVSIFMGYIGIIKGGQKLADFINNYTFAEGEKLNIVAHSHGGNIVKVASLLINRQVDNLVTLGTPQNTDLAPINFHRAAKNHCNVSSLVDYKQFYGASPLQVYMTGYLTYEAVRYAAMAYAAYSMAHHSYHIFGPYSYWYGYYLGQAYGYTRASALLLASAAAMYMSTKINPLAHRNVILGYESHHDLITAETWIDNTRSGCGL